MKFAGSWGEWELKGEDKKVNGEEIRLTSVNCQSFGNQEHWDSVCLPRNKQVKKCFKWRLFVRQCWSWVSALGLEPSPIVQVKPGLSSISLSLSMFKKWGGTCAIMVRVYAINISVKRGIFIYSRAISWRLPFSIELLCSKSAKYINILIFLKPSLQKNEVATKVVITAITFLDIVKI